MQNGKSGIVKCCCATCEWRSDEFVSVCCNGDSDKRADYVNADDCCPEWEAKKDKEEEHAD